MTLPDIIANSRRIVFFGGAGVSTESGIPDFRSTDGLYNQRYEYPSETILSHNFFLCNTEAFYQFYREKILCVDAQPNPAHYKLAEWEQRGILTAVITQNIDGLHTAAGSQTVYELHGSIHRNHCMVCGAAYDADYMRAQSESDVPRCTCGGILKPDVVLYGETLDDDTVFNAIRALETADTLIVGGTSLVVHPAAGLIHYFHGDALVLINKGETPFDGRANLVIREPIGQVLGAL